jgi:hypothetical protein
MRPSLKTTIAASLAALALCLSLSASPASAKPWPHPGFGHHGFFGPGLALGLVGLAAAGAIAASQDDCVEYRPTYDHWGRYIGQQPVNVCQ